MIQSAREHITFQTGLRMSSEAYFALGETQERYELIDGVVCMSPGPLPIHGAVVAEIAMQIGVFLRTRPIGRVMVEVDVDLGTSPRGGDLVYRPDLLVLRSAQLSKNSLRIVEPPALIVEVVSESSRMTDRHTKKDDYERFGVQEYWIVDPELNTLAFYRLRQGQYVEILPNQNVYRSEAVSGFELDQAAVRNAFRPA